MGRKIGWAELYKDVSLQDNNYLSLGFTVLADRT